MTLKPSTQVLTPSAETSHQLTQLALHQVATDTKKEASLTVTGTGESQPVLD